MVGGGDIPLNAEVVPGPKPGIYTTSTQQVTKAVTSDGSQGRPWAVADKKRQLLAAPSIRQRHHLPRPQGLDAMPAALRADLGHHRVHLARLDVGDVHVGRRRQRRQLGLQLRGAQVLAAAGQQPVSAGCFGVLSSPA